MKHPRRNVTWFIIFFIFFLSCTPGHRIRLHPQAVRAPVPLLQAHAHNDYWHERPLLDALENGFTSIEADIFLIDDQLLVAHDKENVRPDRTLESLYLQPLWNKVRKNGGRVYPGWPTLTLLIDIKSDADSTYRVLKKTLQNYRAMLTHFSDAKIKEGAVTVIVSGNRPIEMMKTEQLRLAGYDGRIGPDMEKSAFLVPLISDKWTDYFTWMGKGDMPAAEQAKLAQIVDKAHATGKRLRFWATTDKPTEARTRLWEKLMQMKVDLISTDDLEGLKEFLLHYSE